MRIRKKNVSEVSISKNDNEVTAINDCLNLLDAGSMINSQDVVVITANCVQQQKPETGIVVGNDSLRGIIKYIKSKNPKRVIVAMGSGQKETREAITAAGFDKVALEEDVEFIDLNHGPFIRIILNHDKPAATNLNSIINEMTLSVSFTQLKFHEEATMSGAIKNIALGWAPAEEHGYPKKNLGIHENLHGFITAMAEVIPIDLSIVSASPAMIGTGPGKGIPKHTGLVLAGTDPVSTDTLGARLLGFKPQGIHYLYDCGNKKIGISNTDNIAIKGICLQDAENIFSNAAYGTQFAVDAK
jgi:uncharacterized protein (DUF362 family)